jgi:hypothetical protein
MANLTAEETALLDQLRQAKAARDRIPPALRKPIGHPEKYANPIGMDEHGDLFLKPDSERQGTEGR